MEESWYAVLLFIQHPSYGKYSVDVLGRVKSSQREHFRMQDTLAFCYIQKEKTGVFA